MYVVRRFVLSSVAFAAWLALVAAPSSAQDSENGEVVVESARLEVGLEGSGVAVVRLEYVLSAPPAGDVGLTVLDFGDARVDSLRFDALPVSEEAEASPAIGSTIPLSGVAGARRVGTLPAAGPRFALRYVVADAWHDAGGRVRLRVPVVGVDALPASNGASVFTAVVTAPAEWSATESFPAGIRRDGESGWVVDLAVVPALVSMRGRSDGSWLPGWPTLVEALALVGLGVFALFGARVLRGVVGRPEEAA